VPGQDAHRVHPAAWLSSARRKRSTRPPRHERPEPITVLLGCAASLCIVACSPPAPDLGTADYSTLTSAEGCAPGAKRGPTGGANRVLTSHEIPFSVRTPANYDATRAHPLLVLYAPGGKHRFASEAYYALTRQATSAGVIVVYPDHLRLSMRAFEELAQVPALVARQWCIDTHRVYLAGHSDGASTAAAIAFLGKSSLPPSALVLSAAGIRKQDLEAYACPRPVSVMVMHSREDALFPLPAYGHDAAQWWASCNGCTQPAEPPDSNGCVHYRACTDGVQTLYCETTGQHAQWSPDDTSKLLGFLQQR
jgi:polyhydroxybutyrate depolymerase